MVVHGGSAKYWVDRPARQCHQTRVFHVGLDFFDLKAALDTYSTADRPPILHRVARPFARTSEFTA